MGIGLFKVGDDSNIEPQLFHFVQLGDDLNPHHKPWYNPNPGMISWTFSKKSLQLDQKNNIL